MKFVTENIFLIAIAVASGAMLFWPLVTSRMVGPRVDNHGATRLINDQGAILVDVRSSNEFAAGHLPQARNIPVADIEKHHEERYNQLSKNIEDGAVFFRNGKTYWQCRNCGYIVEADSAPSVCPVCAHPQAFFQINMINY